VHRQTDRRNSNFSNRRHSHAGDREFYGRCWHGRTEAITQGSLTLTRSNLTRT
jgi:hypothetical protein